MTVRKYPNAIEGHTHDTHTDDDDWDNAGEDEKSKTQLKKEMLDLQKLAKDITELSRDQLKKVPLDEDTRDAFESTRKVRGHEGMRRHMQFLGRIMRRLDDEDVAAIRRQMEVFSGVSKAETAKLHRIERLRDKLIANDQALTDLIASHPQVDAQNLRTLIRNARREHLQNKPPKAFREIYQVLRQLHEGPKQGADDAEVEADEDQHDDA